MFITSRKLNDSYEIPHVSKYAIGFLLLMGIILRTTADTLSLSLNEKMGTRCLFKLDMNKNPCEVDIT
jgi:hypothetical protein